MNASIPSRSRNCLDEEEEAAQQEFLRQHPEPTFRLDLADDVLKPSLLLVGTNTPSADFVRLCFPEARVVGTIVQEASTPLVGVKCDLRAATTGDGRTVLIVDSRAAISGEFAADVAGALFDKVHPDCIVLFDTLFVTEYQVGGARVAPPVLRVCDTDAMRTLASRQASTAMPLEQGNMIGGFTAAVLGNAEIRGIPARAYISLREPRLSSVTTLSFLESLTFIDGVENQKPYFGKEEIARISKECHQIKEMVSRTLQDMYA